MINRREFISGVAVAGAVPSARPNILLIMTDQHRMDAIGAYGNNVIRTPHLDFLADGGTRFTNRWTQHPVCMPSRASIFTGRYPSSHRVRTNGVRLPVSETTLAKALLDSGYSAFGAGKFHFIPHHPYRSPCLRWRCTRSPTTDSGSSTFVQEIDVMPTILDLAGLSSVPGLQGRSQSPVLTTNSSDTGYTSALIEGATSCVSLPGLPADDSSSSDVWTLRNAQWRLSYYPGQPVSELYDLSSDPNEFANLWNRPALKATQNRLIGELLDASSRPTIRSRPVKNPTDLRYGCALRLRQVGIVAIAERAAAICANGPRGSGRAPRSRRSRKPVARLPPGRARRPAPRPGRRR